MDRKEYQTVKKKIKEMCIDNVRELAKQVGLNDYETKILEMINHGDSRVQMSLALGCCESKLTKDSRKIFVRILDQIKRQE